METWGGDWTSFIETWQVLIRKLWGFLCLKDRAPIMTSGISEGWGHQYRENCPIDLNSSRYVIGWESEIRMTFLRCRDRKFTSLSVETKFSLLYNLQTCLVALISTALKYIELKDRRLKNNSAIVQLSKAMSLCHYWWVKNFTTRQDKVPKKRKIN